MTAYTATASNGTDSITATADDPAATVVIDHDGAAVANGGQVTWNAGANTVAVKVTNGDQDRTYTVTVSYTPPGPPETRLSALTIGSLSLMPPFDPDTESYTAATTNNTNTVTATAMDSAAAISIQVDGQPVASGTAATWADGDNSLTIKVENGSADRTYTVTVTKS